MHINLKASIGPQIIKMFYDSGINVDAENFVCWLLDYKQFHSRTDYSTSVGCAVAFENEESHHHGTTIGQADNSLPWGLQRVNKIPATVLLKWEVECFVPKTIEVKVRTQRHWWRVVDKSEHRCQNLADALSRDNRLLFCLLTENTNFFDNFVFGEIKLLETKLKSQKVNTIFLCWYQMWIHLIDFQILHQPRGKTVSYKEREI